MKSKNQAKTVKYAYLKSLIIPAAALLIIIIQFVISFIITDNSSAPLKSNHTVGNIPELIDVQLIDKDGHSRRGIKLNEVNDIVIHYVANPMSTAQNNRDYFNNPESNVSSHFVVGLEGEIIQCVPLDEISSASNDRNTDTVSIEVCHEDETGKFNADTYQALVNLTAWLCMEYDLSTEHIIRHYDITGKLCPLYYVEHEDEWERFKSEVGEKIESNTKSEG